MIHQFQQDGINVLIDVNSGAVHVVDDVVYELVKDYENYQDSGFSLEELSIQELSLEELSLEELSKKHSSFSKEVLEEALEEIKELANAGMLFTADDYSEVLPLVNKRAPVVKALCLHVAHDCNLKCKYCFAEEGEYHGKRELMSFEVGKAALDFLIANSGSRHNLEVDFFGGEPLMNFDVVKELVKYGRELEKTHDKRFRFTITTNGVLLDDAKEEFINEHMHNLVLSLDGRKEINDAMRPRAGGQGSYDLIVPKYQKIAESRNQKDYFVRGTFTRHNLDFSNDVLHMADLGFKQISVEPVVAAPEEDYSIREEDLPIIFAEYDKLAKAIFERRKAGNDFHFFHFSIDLSGGPCVMKRLSGCGAGTEYLAVTPDGSLYPCHQFVGMDGFLMGNVNDGVKNIALKEEFSKCNVYAKDTCKNCWAKFYCSGGCAANAYQYGGGLLTPYAIGCEMQKKRVECAIMLMAKEMAE